MVATKYPRHCTDVHNVLQATESAYKRHLKYSYL